MRNSKLVQFYYLGEKSFNKLSEIVKKRKIDEDSRVVYIIDHFFTNKNILSSIVKTTKYYLQIQVKSQELSILMN